jgi:hypothetical protein
MLRCDSKGDFVLRVLDGRSERREVAFTLGHALPPFAVGSEAAWSVSAVRVARAHVMLAFNGARLFACALPGELALLDGAPLDGRWTEMKTPSELRFGGARISVGRRAGPDELTEVPGDEATRIEEPTAIANVARVGAGRAEEVTCFDEDRLQAALRLSAAASGGTSVPASSDVTCIAAVGVPAAAKGPANDEITTPPSPPLPAPRPVAATVRIAKKTVLAARAAAAATAPLRAPMAVRSELREAISPSAKMTARLLAGLDGESVVPSAEITMLEASRAPGPVEEPSEAFSGVPSSMPPTIPSDGLLVAAPPAWGSPFPAAAARPSSPTIAIALPLPQSLPLPVAYPAVEEDPRTPPPYALESLRTGGSGEGASMRASVRETSSLGQRKLGELAMGWRQASLPKKAIAILMLPALLGALLTLRPASSARASSAVASASSTAGASQTSAPRASGSAPAASASAAVAPAAVASAAVASAGGASVAATAEAVPSKATPAGLRETRSAERRALDTVASGLDASAAEQYAALAAAHPDNLAYSEASRILRARAATRHD